MNGSQVKHVAPAGAGQDKEQGGESRGAKGQGKGSGTKSRRRP